MHAIPDRIRHCIRSPLSRTPYLYDAAIALRPRRRGDLARRHSSIVIEGFLRSGNTFSVAAFRVSNGTDHHIGRHLHAAAHVHRAVRLGRPTIVLIREPADAVISYLIRRPTLTPGAALREYIGFYRSLWRLRASFVVGPFDLMVSDFGAVIEAVNRRFGTAFLPYEPTPDNDEAAFRIVEEMNRRECGGMVVETHVARPSADRRAARQELSRLLESPRFSSLLEEARDLHDRYLDLAATQLGHVPSMRPEWR
jgi:hypothetical protein